MWNIRQAILPPEWQDDYSSRAAWDGLQEAIIEPLLRLAT